MVTDYSDREREREREKKEREREIPQSPLHRLLFLISSKCYFICTSNRQERTYHSMGPQ